MATKIMIDAGHGGSDPGAVYNDRLEKTDNLNLALAVGDILEGMGYDVEYTRTTDRYDSPVEKARIGNASGADYFISFHRNSSPNANTLNGVQTLVYSDSGVKGQMARNINSELEKLGFRNINVEERPDLAVLRRTRMPALLIETGFINSDVDNKLFDERFQDIANAIAEGINETLTQPVMSIIGENRKTPKYQILVGIYRGFATASYQMNKVKDDGYTADVYEDDGLFQVRVGEYDSIDEAMDGQKKLRNRGYSTLIVEAL